MDPHVFDGLDVLDEASCAAAVDRMLADFLMFDWPPIAAKLRDAGQTDEAIARYRGEVLTMARRVSIANLDSLRSRHLADFDAPVSH